MTKQVCSWDCGQKKKIAKHTTGGIPRWSPTLVLVARFSAYVWQSGRDAQFSLTYGRMYLSVIIGCDNLFDIFSGLADPQLMVGDFVLPSFGDVLSPPALFSFTLSGSTRLIAHHLVGRASSSATYDRVPPLKPNVPSTIPTVQYSYLQSALSRGVILIVTGRRHAIP